MSGFFVSNSFGHFNSESATKEFNAVQLIGIPSAPSTTTFEKLLQNKPAVTGLGDASAWGINDDLHIKQGKDGGKSSGENLGGQSGDHKWPLSESQAEKFFQWVDKSSSEPWMLLYPGDAFKWVGHQKTTAKFQIRYVTNSRPTPAHAYEYVHNIKKSGTGDNVEEVSALSSNSCFSNYFRDDDAGSCGFDVELTGDDYMSIDVGLVESEYGATSDIHASRFKTQCGTWEHRNPSAGGKSGSRKNQSNEPQDEGIQRVNVKLVSLTWNPVEGCTDPDANNTNTNATPLNRTYSSSCTYTTALISSFTASSPSIKVGETATISWTLSNTNFSEIKIFAKHGDRWLNIMPDTHKDAIDSSIPVSPTSVGTTYKMEVTWDKPNAPIRKADLNLSVVSAPSYVPCDPADIHRNVDGNGECAGCKAGYSMIDATTGFCTNCEATNDDAYRDMNTDGTCGDCMAGYAEDTEGKCKVVGCMTFNDGTSASGDADKGAIHPGDYNYDPNAEINDSSKCENPDGLVNDGNGGDGRVPEDIDCELSDWSDWSEWSDAATSSGTRTRTRTVVTAQSGGGAVCPSLEETETGVVDPDTGTVTTTTTGGDSQPVETTTETKSLAAPLIIGGIALAIGVLVLRR